MMSNARSRAASPRARRSIRRGLTAPTLFLAASLAAGPAVAPAPVSAQQDLRTEFEQSGYEEFTSHEGMWDYLEELQALSAGMKLGVYGETWEGRKLPYAIFSRPTVTQPWEAWTLDRPILVLAANVHGGERNLRESLLILMRDLATPGTGPNALLDDVVIVATPQINPDGFTRANRGNARGIDLNRDYVKLEHPEIQAYVGNVIQKWQPHLYIDGHNGGSFPYNLNYQCPSHADPDQRITGLCDDEIFPNLNTRLEAEGYEAWYYTGGNEEEWRVGGNEARIGRNYGGFANMVGILFESPGGQTREEATRAGYLGYLSVVEYAAGNPRTLMETVQRARLETVTMGMQSEGEVTIEMEYEAEPEPVTYKISDRPAQGEEREIVTVTEGRLMKRPVPIRTRPRPYAYILPPEAREAVEMLQRHDITVEVLREETTLPVQAYTLADIQYERAYDHNAATEVTVGEVVEIEEEFPAGSFVVSTAQMMGRLVAHMLEPESTDNVVYWNTMDAWLPKEEMAERQAGEADPDDDPPIIPIYKLMEARPLPTRLLEGAPR